MRTVLVALMVAQTAVVGAVVGSLSLVYGRRSVDELADQLVVQTGQRVDRTLVELLRSTHSTNEMISDVIELSGLKGPYRPGQERVFVRALSVFDVTLSGLGFETGDHMAARRHPDGSVTVSFVEAGEQIDRRYSTTADGSKGELIRTSPVRYDPRERPWYTAAVAEGGPVWTEPYLDFNSGLLGITAAMPLYVDDELLGVLGTDVQFDHLERFLAELHLGEGGVAFVVDERGLLIASSTGDPVMVDERRVDGRSAVHPVVRGASSALSEVTPAVQHIRIDGLAHYMHTAEVHSDLGLHWRIVVVVPRHVLMKHVDTNLWWTAVSCLLALLLAAVIGVLLTRRISEPLRLVSSEMERVAMLDLDDSGAALSRIDEVHTIQGALIHMKRELRSFRKYVPRQLVQRLSRLRTEAVLGVEEAEVTLFFSDLAGFTSISESMEGTRLVEIMSAYLGEMSRIVIAREGTLDKYIGDAIMAFWNAPAPVPNHPSIALGVALDSQARLAEMRAEHPDWPPLFMRIGLHTGPVLVGNFGSPERMDYTALGDAVNLAARLESLNKQYGTEILVSEAVADRVDDVLLRRIDVVAVKGRAAPTLVYEPIGRKGEVEPARIDIARRYEDALACYLDRDFQRAIGLLERLAHDDPGDGPTRTLLKRCRQFVVSPPAADWDGVFQSA